MRETALVEQTSLVGRMQLAQLLAKVGRSETRKKGKRQSLGAAASFPEISGFPTHVSCRKKIERTILRVVKKRENGASVYEKKVRNGILSGR